MMLAHNFTWLLRTPTCRPGPVNVGGWGYRGGVRRNQRRIGLVCGGWDLQGPPVIPHEIPTLLFFASRRVLLLRPVAVDMKQESA